MERELHIACIGAWQAHAKEFAKKVNSYDHCRVTAVYDRDPDTGKHWAEIAGCKYAESYEEILSDSDIDGVVITDANTRHADLVIKAAEAGKNIYVEKPAFVTNEEAYRAREVIRRTGVKFMVADPIIPPPLMLAKKMYEEGKLGKITCLRVRMAHPEALTGEQAEGVYDPQQSGGGAMLDMGHHVCHMIEWFLGRPKSAFAALTSITEKAKSYGTEDNVVAVFEYEDGTIAVGESGWVSDWYQGGMSVFGTKGCLVSQDQETKYCLKRNEDGRTGKWISVAREDYPPMRTYPLQYWIESILADTPIERENIDEAVLLTEMFNAAYRSAGKTELL